MNIFFWPWALLLGGLLGWLTVGRTGATDWQWAFLGLLFLAGLGTAWRSGLARTLPWLLIAGFCLGGNGARWALYCALSAGIVVIAVGWFATEKVRVAADHFRWRLLLQIGILWAVALICVGLSCLAGWALTFVPELWVLRFALAVVALYLQFWEFQWAGWMRARPWPLFICGAGLLASFIFADPVSSFLLWSALVSLMAWLEIAESRERRAGLVWPTTVLVCEVALIAAWYLAGLRPLFGYVVVVLLLLAGWLEPTLRFRRALNGILAQVGGDDDEFVRPSWIAHSLGAFLSGKLFNEVDLPIDRLLFVGAAISEAYDWRPYLVNPGPTIEQVRDEFGSLDAVIWLLSMSGPWAGRQGLGGAGWVGLRPLGLTVHDVDNHRAGCGQCVVGHPPVRIHNYRLPGFSHSTFFLRKKHARDYWAPYLWGHAPNEVRDFLLRCRELWVAYVESSQNSIRFMAQLTHFKTAAWNWYLVPTGPRTFSEYVHDEVGAQIAGLAILYPGLATAPSDLVVNLAATQLSGLVVEGIWEQNKPTERDADLVAVLNPPVAIRKASLSAYRGIAQKLLDGWEPPPDWRPPPPV